MKTTTPSSLHRLLGLTCALLTCGVTLASCSSANDDAANDPAESSTSSGASSSDAASEAADEPTSGAAALVPADIKERGFITVVTDATYPPYGYFDDDGKTILGIDIDTAHALEPVLGIDIKIVNASFDAFIPGLQSGRYDAGFNAISDTPERRKVVDFVDFNQYGGVFLTVPDSPVEIADLSSACGLSVGAEKGSDTIKPLEGLAPTCEEAGKNPVNVKIFGSQADALVALTSGRVDTVLAGSTGGYLAEQSGGKYIANGPLIPNLDGDVDLGGMALPKDSPMTDAMVAGLTELFEDGTLTSIYNQYSVASQLIQPAVNAAP